MSGATAPPMDILSFYWASITKKKTTYDAIVQPKTYEDAAKLYNPPLESSAKYRLLKDSTYFFKGELKGMPSIAFTVLKNAHAHGYVVRVHVYQAEGKGVTTFLKSQPVWRLFPLPGACKILHAFGGGDNKLLLENFFYSFDINKETFIAQESNAQNLQAYLKASDGSFLVRSGPIANITSNPVDKGSGFGSADGVDDAEKFIEAVKETGLQKDIAIQDAFVSPSEANAPPPKSASLAPAAAAGGGGAGGGGAGGDGAGGDADDVDDEDDEEGEEEHEEDEEEHEEDEDVLVASDTIPNLMDGDTSAKEIVKATDATWQPQKGELYSVTATKGFKALIIIVEPATTGKHKARLVMVSASPYGETAIKDGLVWVNKDTDGKIQVAKIENIAQIREALKAWVKPKTSDDALNHLVQFVYSGGPGAFVVVKGMLSSYPNKKTLHVYDKDAYKEFSKKEGFSADAPSTAPARPPAASAADLSKMPNIMEGFWKHINTKASARSYKPITVEEVYTYETGFDQDGKAAFRWGKDYYRTVDNTAAPAPARAPAALERSVVERIIERHSQWSGWTSGGRYVVHPWQNPNGDARLERPGFIFTVKGIIDSTSERAAYVQVDAVFAPNTDAGKKIANETPKEGVFWYTPGVTFVDSLERTRNIPDVPSRAKEASFRVFEYATGRFVPKELHPTASNPVRKPSAATTAGRVVTVYEDGSLHLTNGQHVYVGPLSGDFVWEPLPDSYTTARRAQDANSTIEKLAKDYTDKLGALEYATLGNLEYDGFKLLVRVTSVDEGTKNVTVKAIGAQGRARNRETAVASLRGYITDKVVFPASGFYEFVKVSEDLVAQEMPQFLENAGEPLSEKNFKFFEDVSTDGGDGSAVADPFAAAASTAAPPPRRKKTPPTQDRLKRPSAEKRPKPSPHRASSGGGPQASSHGYPYDGTSQPTDGSVRRWHHDEPSDAYTHVHDDTDDDADGQPYVDMPFSVAGDDVIDYTHVATVTLRKSSSANIARRYVFNANTHNKHGGKITYVRIMSWGPLGGDTQVPFAPLPLDITQTPYDISLEVTRRGAFESVVMQRVYLKKKCTWTRPKKGEIEFSVGGAGGLSFACKDDVVAPASIFKVEDYAWTPFLLNVSHAPAS